MDPGRCLSLHPWLSAALPTQEEPQAVPDEGRTAFLGLCHTQAQVATPQQLSGRLLDPLPAEAPVPSGLVNPHPHRKAKDDPKGCGPHSTVHQRPPGMPRPSAGQSQGKEDSTVGHQEPWSPGLSPDMPRASTRPSVMTASRRAQRVETQED